MIRLKITVFCLVFSATSFVLGQDFKFGKVSKEELTENVYPQDSSAVASVLYRHQSVRFSYTQGVGFKLLTDVHERVKIYSKDGFDYATVSQLLYKNGSDAESISGLKAYTYNLENGKIEKSKMEKSAVFKTSRSKYRNEEKFTLPNVKEGSVLEYHYQITSPFYSSVDEIDLQYDIPIKKLEIAVEIPEYFVFKPLMKGYLPISPKLGTKAGRINYTSKNRSNRYSAATNFDAQTIEYKINTTHYDIANVPALKEEPYVNDMDNYRSAVKYELQYIQFPQEARESYSTTWEDVIKKIYKSDSFGGQLKSGRYFQEDLEKLMAATTTESELIAAIFLHVQGRMNWNSIYGYGVDKGVKTAYKERSGNIADINLILTSMLQEAGLNANPVLVSTRDHGVPMFPTREGFNYVVTAVELEGGTVLLDATNKYTKPNLLPTRALNWFGKMIKKDGTAKTLNLIPKKVSRESTNVSVVLKANGDIEGKARKSYTDYDSYAFRNRYAAADEEDYLEKLENRNNGMEISDYAIKNKKTVGKPVMESFTFNLESQANIIGDKMYFSPMFYMAMTENPFKLEDRNYPIDFTYPWQEKFVMNIKLPEGYQLTSKPENMNMALVNKMGSFKYQIVENGSGVQVMVDLKINEAVISANYYADLKELFKNVVEKQTEKLVLSKTSSDGTADSSGKSR